MPYALLSQVDRGVVAAHFVHVIDDVIRLEDQRGGKISERHVEHHSLLSMPRQRRKVRNHGCRRQRHHRRARYNSREVLFQHTAQPRLQRLDPGPKLRGPLGAHVVEMDGLDHRIDRQ